MLRGVVNKEGACERGRVETETMRLVLLECPYCHAVLEGRPDAKGVFHCTSCGAQVSFRNEDVCDVPSDEAEASGTDETDKADLDNPALMAEQLRGGMWRHWLSRALPVLCSPMLVAIVINGIILYGIDPNRLLVFVPAGLTAVIAYIVISADF